MRVYLVKEGDSLWSIAQNELGDGARWREIRDIHGNPYSEGTTIHPGWQIQLPN